MHWLCRRRPGAARPVRLIIGSALALNEFGWWFFRYSHEGIHARNLPLQLCDITCWATVVACFTLAPRVVEFDYFAGLAGAGMALLTPDLWSPWPSYPAIAFFISHGGIVIGISVLIFGRVATLSKGAVWRAFAMLLAYAALAGIFNAVFGTNHMYLCAKPANASPLDAFGPWPAYLGAAAVAAIALFWMLWLIAATARAASAE